MKQILSIMLFLGAFTFISMVLCVANSIEAKESERAGNIMTFIAVIDLLSCVCGFMGLLIYNTI